MRVQLQLTKVTFTKGHDGFLRGKPEPVLLAAALAAAHDRVELLARVQLPLRVTRSYPCTQTFPDPPPLLFEAKIAPEQRLALLVMALESDKGTDITRLLVGLDQPGDWTVRAGDSALAAPFQLAELALLPHHQPPAAQPVHLTWRDKDVSGQCEADDWIGACLVLPQGGRRLLQGWELRFLSANRRNDWTAAVRLRVT